MATVPITSQITTSKDNRTDTDTDLSIVNTEDEMHTNLSTWTPTERKKLQHMTEFHEEYQHVFGEKASTRTIMKCRISHMNPHIPKSVCEEEMQNTNLDTNEVIIEYMTDAQGNKIKKLKPLLIKSEPDREYAQHIPSDDNLPAVPEENFIQKREVTVDSYSESIPPMMSLVMIDLQLLIAIVLPPQVLKKHHVSGKLILKKLKLSFIK